MSFENFRKALEGFPSQFTDALSFTKAALPGPYKSVTFAGIGG